MARKRDGGSAPRVCGCVLVSGLLSLGAGAAEETPRWIGLDTTLRDRQAWTAPDETVCAASLDTRISDAAASDGRTIRGTYRGLLLCIR